MNKFQILNPKSKIPISSRILDRVGTNSKLQTPNSKIEKILPKTKRNILLKNYTTFGLGGPAKYFFEAKNKEALIKAILAAKKFKLPFFILGNGSNLLVSDKGYRGLVINFQFSIFNFQKNKITVGAGTKLGELVNASVEKGLTGIEWAIGIPGTVGGAIWGNAGAFGSSMKDITKTVAVLEIQNPKSKIQNKFKIRKLKNKDCNFGYRDSIFKKKKNQSTECINLCASVLGRAHKSMCSDLIILSAELQLKKGNKSKIKEKMKEYLNYRKETQPLDLPSAGSIFQNPPKFSAGELIEKCGLKGRRIGGAKVSEKHANFIVNLGKAKAKDVKKLIDLIKQKVKNKFGITLEEEISYLGLAPTPNLDTNSPREFVRVFKKKQ